MAETLEKITQNTVEEGVELSSTFGPGATENLVDFNSTL